MPVKELPVFNYLDINRQNFPNFRAWYLMTRIDSSFSWHKNYCNYSSKINNMITRKDGSNQNLEERNKTLSSDYERVSNEDEMDTREISHDIEEGDEELTEKDFEVDEADEEDDEEII